MGQIFFQDNIPSAVRASTTSVTLAATNRGQPTRITIGGQQYAPPSTLTLNTASSGVANGLDTGTVSNTHSLYYVYAIANQSSFSPALIGSLSSPSTGPLMPSGYGTAYKLVGAFYSMDSGASIGSMVTIDGEANSDWQQFTPALTTGTRATTYSEKAYWRRKGVDVEINYWYSHTNSAGAANGSGVYGFGLPTSLSLTSILSNSVSISASSDIGVAQVSTSTTNLAGTVYAADGTNLALFVTNSTSEGAISATFNGFASAATIQYTFRASVPVTGWTSTLL